MLVIKGGSSATGPSLKFEAFNGWTRYTMSTRTNGDFTIESNGNNSNGNFVYKNGSFIVEDSTGIEDFTFKYSGFNPVKLGLVNASHPFADLRFRVLHHWQTSSYRDFVLTRAGMMNWHAMNLSNLDSSSVCATFKAAPAQTANITEWQDSSGNVLSSVDASGNFIMSNLPTSDPGVLGALWNDSGALKISI